MDTYQLVRNLAAIFLQQELAQKRSLTREMIQGTVERVCADNRLHLAQEERARLSRELEAEFQTVIGRESELRGDAEDWFDWLRERSAAIEWGYWLRYKSFLGQRGFSPQVCARLDESTDRVLNLMGDPARSGKWDRRGLVVGLVQSGKTAHYVGLVNKATDAGYKVIIILTGFNENLRVQTQMRIEDGYLGYSFVPDGGGAGVLVNRACGVGIVSPLAHRVDSVTTRHSDFRASIARNFAIHPGGNPIVFVMKKNATVLRHLLQWVVNFASAIDDAGHKYVSGIPLLVIDDESDVGSIDTRRGAVDDEGEVDQEHDPSKINKQIRKVLSLFDQSSYVGYTATPFANVLIHDLLEAGTDSVDDLLVGEDLFPRSFIVSLPAPSNHVGPARMFGARVGDETTPQGLPIIRSADDASVDAHSWVPETHRRDHVPRHGGRDEVPPSLRRAILSFVLVCAERKLRGDGRQHASMLIHVTRYIDVQARVYEQVYALLADIRDRLRNNTATAELLSEFHNLWEYGVVVDGVELDAGFVRTSALMRTECGGEDCDDVHSWIAIQAELRDAVEAIEVRRIHGDSGEDLNYERYPNGLKVIAIGGDKLSRGLTLEGLAVSYFLRCSRMYDTLMQMGRWFGYRPRYLDLCRLYTTGRLCRWFAQIADATEELRSDFERMAAIGATPKDFGLRVRSHPEMMITADVKMRYGTSIQVTFQGAITETIDFAMAPNIVADNWAAGTALVTAAAERGVRVPETESPANWEWRDVPPGAVLAFLGKYKTHGAAHKVRPERIREYIEIEVQRSRLKRWRILVAEGGANDARGRKFDLGPASGVPVVRAWHVNGDQEMKKRLKDEGHYRIRRLVSPSHESAGISRNSPEYEDAMRRTLAAWEMGAVEDEPERKRPTEPGGRFYREVRSPEEGVLILYPLDATRDEPGTPDWAPILGFAISFPSVPELSATRVTYRCNNVFDQQERALM